VEQEQQGDDTPEYGARLLERLSEDLQHKPGKGFSVRNLRKMRRFYLNNRNRPAPADLTWTQHVELLPVTNKADKRRLERRIIRDNLSRSQIRQEVRLIEKDKSPPAMNLRPRLHRSGKALFGSVSILRSVFPRKVRIVRTYWASWT